MNKVQNNGSADTPIAINFERVRADFPDGGEIHLESKELGMLLPKTPELDLDSEYNYVVVGVHWERTSASLVQLPKSLAKYFEGELAPGATNREQDDYDYDRAAHIDRAIAALQRAKALLQVGRPSDLASAS